MCQSVGSLQSSASVRYNSVIVGVCCIERLTSVTQEVMGLGGEKSKNRPGGGNSLGGWELLCN